MPGFAPYAEEKVWGSVQHVFSSSNASVSCLTVKRCTRCSIHYHRERVNLFNVLDGLIAVELFGDQRIVDTPDIPAKVHILRPGDVLDVACNQWHRFRVLESGRVVEVYYPWMGGRVRMDDIIRYDVGGLDNQADQDRLLKE